MRRIETAGVLKQRYQKYGGEARGDCRLDEGERTAVAETAAMLVGMLMKVLRRQRGRLRKYNRAQQEQKGKNSARSRSL
jgi:hypothetical protein